MYRICSQCHSINDQPERSICTICEHNILSEIAERNELRFQRPDDRSDDFALDDLDDDFGLMTTDQAERMVEEYGSEEPEGDSPLWI